MKGPEETQEEGAEEPPEILEITSPFLNKESKVLATEKGLAELKDALEDIDGYAVFANTARYHKKYKKSKFYTARTNDTASESA